MNYYKVFFHTGKEIRYAIFVGTSPGNAAIKAFSKHKNVFTMGKYAPEKIDKPVDNEVLNYKESICIEYEKCLNFEDAMLATYRTTDDYYAAEAM